MFSILHLFYVYVKRFFHASEYKKSTCKACLYLKNQYYYTYRYFYRYSAPRPEREIISEIDLKYRCLDNIL